jgi:2-aminoadipate transaminase
MQTPWEYRYANRTRRMGSSVIRELLKLTEQPDIISFGGGLPAPEVFPVKNQEISRSLQLRSRD